MRDPPPLPSNKSDDGRLPSRRTNTPTGTMAVSSPELTAIDLANRPENSGGIDNVATVLIDLARDSRLDEAQLTKLVARFPAAASRRVGWIVERFTDVRLDALADASATAADEPSNLDQHGPRRGPVDRRWRVRVNTTIEPDL